MSSGIYVLPKDEPPPPGTFDDPFLERFRRHGYRFEPEFSDEAELRDAVSIAVGEKVQRLRFLPVSPPWLVPVWAADWLQTLDRRQCFDRKLPAMPRAHFPAPTRQQLTAYLAGVVPKLEAVRSLARAPSVFRPEDEALFLDCSSAPFRRLWRKLIRIGAYSLVNTVRKYLGYQRADDRSLQYRVVPLMRFLPDLIPLASHGDPRTYVLMSRLM